MGIISTINTFVPFADPSRPIWIDITYSLVLCTILWLGPQIQQSFLKITKPLHLQPPETAQEVVEDVPNAPNPVVPAEDPIDSDSSDSETDLLNDPAFQQFLNENVQPEPVALPPAANEADRHREQLQPLPHQPARQRDPNRPVGAKKARSLARRQQMRAYNEFLREQGDQQRAIDASTSAAREATQKAERERRAAAEAKIRESEEAAREAKKAKERKDREAEARTVNQAKRYISGQLESYGLVQLGAAAKELGKDEGWLISMLKSEGVVGFTEVQGKRRLVMLTAAGYIVRIDEEEMEQLYQELLKDGEKTRGITVSSDELGTALTQILLRRSQTSHG
jgi:hypothetical protein